jgi:dihydropteroate synthase
MSAREMENLPEPAPIRCGDHILHLERRPHLMGIVNATPDSFSDGGDFLEPQKAVEHGLEMAEQGADLIDVGGESTRPGSAAVDADEEIRRVVPVIEGLVRYCTIPVSIDTTKAAVAEAALAAGASMVNDVSACRFDPLMVDVVAKATVPVVVMHMLGEPKSMQAGAIHYSDLLGEVATHLQEATDRLSAAGVRKRDIIWDPGIGFGKTVKHNLMLINRLPELARHGHALLVGPSRKSFIGKVLDVEVGERLFGTAGTVAACVLRGAHIVRVHDMKEMRQVAFLASAIRNERHDALPPQSRRNP